MNWTLKRLGLREGQGFRVQGRPRDTVYRIAEGMLLKEEGENGAPVAVGSSVLMEILENPGLVIRSKQLTPEQEELLLCLVNYFGYEWLAADESGIVYAHQTKPTKAMSVWARSGLDSLLPLAIRHRCVEGLVNWEDSEPMSIEETLCGQGR